MIYKDPHKRKLVQFTTDRNDGLITGSCPFAILLNLNNVDDKIVLPEWLLKPPKIIWDGTEILSVEINITSNGELPEDYLTKYIVKGQPKRGAKGEVMVAAYEKLEPENAVTTGVFAKMYNRVSSKGPIPIFNVVHNNLNLPLVMKNFETKACSVLGISTIANSNNESIEEDIDNFLDSQMSDDIAGTEGKK